MQKEYLYEFIISSNEIDKYVLESLEQFYEVFGCNYENGDSLKDVFFETLMTSVLEKTTSFGNYYLKAEVDRTIRDFYNFMKRSLQHRRKKFEIEEE